MERKEIEKKIEDLFYREFLSKHDVLTQESHLFDDFRFDEIDISNLEMSLEKLFRLTMILTISPEIKTVRDLVSLIEKLLE